MYKQGLTLPLSPEVSKDLIELKKELGLSTAIEVLELGLNVLEWVLKMRKDRRKITGYKPGVKPIVLELPKEINIAGDKPSNRKRYRTSAKM